MIRAGLLLNDAARRWSQVFNEFRPFNPRFNLDDPGVRIEMDDLVQTSTVHDHSVLTELLPSHGVPGSRWDNRPAAFPRISNGSDDFPERLGLQDITGVRRV